ncbi:hypothetical protein IV50_GL000405 [Weissella viridescens]|uniref:Arginine repressor n=2 Tax=Weissella viridescens TaxID=1629 RepID=A0A0R2H310_WEIVI|nr:hypothetical protein IV50_GL000405 [Weissella viridescens]
MNIEDVNMPTKKQNRQLKILDIISKNVIDSQEKLMDALKEAGYSVTQATVSRDINELKIVRHTDENGLNRYQVLEPYAADELSQLKLNVTQLVNSVEQVEFMVILKTAEGNGNRIAALIDHVNFKYIVGTLAGHDTIFVMTHNADEAKRTAETIQAWL